MGSLFGKAKAVQTVAQPAPQVDQEPQTEDKKKNIIRALLLGTEGEAQGVLSKATTARGKLLGN